MSIALHRADQLVEDEWPVPDGYELVDGELVEKPIGAESGLAAGELYRRMAAHCDATGAGKALPGDIGFRCFPHRPRLLRKPDGSFIRADRLVNGRVPTGDIAFPPDLVIEAVSPNELAEVLQEKVNDYLTAGTRLVWVIYPVLRMAVAHALGGGATWIDEAGELDGRDVVPGFRCRLHDILQPRDPEASIGEDSSASE